MSHLIREELSSLANELDRVRLTLAVAPGGSGKTTLLRSWQQALTANGCATAWLNLSSIHADVATMIEDFVDALRVAISEPRFCLDLLRDISHVDLEDAPILARRVARALREIDRPIVVFVDNFHLLEPTGTTERVVDLLIRNESVPIHFVIASRGARPSCTASLLAANQARVVEASDLLLRSDQIAAVLDDKGIQRDSVLPLLLAETRGWATGVQLAARALEHLPSEEHTTFIRSLGRHPDLFEYVANEIISEEETALIEMLERAALTGPLSEPILDRVASDFGVNRRVEDALAKGLLIREDGRIGVHHLWEDLLKRRLRRRIAAEDHRALNRRLGESLRSIDPRRTLVLWSDAEFWDGVVEILVEHGRGWIYSGRVRFVADWLAKLPAGRVEDEPHLTYLAALTRQRHDAAEAIASLEETSTRLRRLGDHRQSSAALMDAVIVAQNENMTSALQRLLPRLLSLRRLATDRDARALGVFAIARLAGSRNRFALAVRILRKMRSVEHSQVQRASVVMGLMLIGQYRDTAENLDLLDEVVDHPAYRDHAPSHWMFVATRALMRGYRDQGRERCVVELRDAAEAFEDFGLTMAEMRCRDPLGRLLIFEGRQKEALEEFERAAALAHRIDDAAFEATMRARAALVLIALNRNSEARVTTRRAVALLEEQGEKPRGTILMRFPEMVVWRALAECGHAAQALSSAQSHARDYRSPDLVIATCQTALQMARIAKLAGHDSECHRHLESVREIVTRHGQEAFGSDLDPEILSWAEKNLDPANRERAGRWDIRSLGGIQVVKDGTPIPERAWRGATTRRLLLRLLAGEGSERREVLQLDLWPDSAPGRGAANLRVALSRLRSALGRNAFQSEGDRVVLDPELLRRWDVSRLKESGAIAASQLYRGPFAPEIYDDWAEDLRREIEARFLAIIRSESKQMLASNPQAALSVAVRLTEVTPLDEDGWILRVRAEQACGDLQSARETLTRARDHFERELGAESGSRLHALERELANA